MKEELSFWLKVKDGGDSLLKVLDANYTTAGIPAKAINGANGLAIYNCGSAYTPGQTGI